MHFRLTKIPDHAITDLNFTMTSLFLCIPSLYYGDMWLMNSQNVRKVKEYLK